ncbi:MAG: hypothetical protein JO189_13695 [Deltaproteobacteria bacterium]|nr:hypothetical protein [Deltaproteobacteria bacterium]
MEIRLEPFSTAEYANIYSSLGRKVKLVGSVYWTRPRPLFYRPLLLYRALHPLEFQPPCRLIGAYQYTSSDHFLANSRLNFLVFEEAENYSIRALKIGLRRFVRVAQRYFEVRVVDSERELKEQGHNIYLSFYSRTRYSYLSERIEKGSFERWIEALRANPKTLFLGGYKKGDLKALAICYRIEDLLLYATFFAETESLRHHISDLMLHTARQVAASQIGIRRVLAGRYGGGIGIDTFYLRRGCIIESKPAHYVITPSVAGSILQIVAPAQFRRLKGL